MKIFSLKPSKNSFLNFSLTNLLIINKIKSEYVYIDQTNKGWHIEPLKVMMEQNELSFDVSAFGDYGCWCGSGQGPHGKPVDELDTICHQMYQCIKVQGGE